MPSATETYPPKRQGCAASPKPRGPRPKSFRLPQDQAGDIPIVPGYRAASPTAAEQAEGMNPPHAPYIRLPYTALPCPAGARGAAIGFDYGAAAAAEGAEEPPPAPLHSELFHPPYPVPEHLEDCLPPDPQQHAIILQTARFVRRQGGQSEFVIQVRQVGRSRRLPAAG